MIERLHEAPLDRQDDSGSESREEQTQTFDGASPRLLQSTYAGANMGHPDRGWLSGVGVSEEVDDRTEGDLRSLSGRPAALVAIYS